MFEFFFYLWLLLPWTDGATLIFDFIMAPLVAPVIQPIVQKLDGLINKLIALVMNAAHLSIVWIVFVFLDPSLKRTIWILLATVFPLGSSIVSVTTLEGGDDTVRNDDLYAFFTDAEWSYLPKILSCHIALNNHSIG